MNKRNEGKNKKTKKNERKTKIVGKKNLLKTFTRLMTANLQEGMVGVNTTPLTNNNIGVGT